MLTSIKVAIFAVTKVSGVSAAQIGLILTYTSKYLMLKFCNQNCLLMCNSAQLTQLCSVTTRQYAEVEVGGKDTLHFTHINMQIQNYMNSVERGSL